MIVSIASVLERCQHALYYLCFIVRKLQDKSSQWRNVSSVWGTVNVECFCVKLQKHILWSVKISDPLLFLFSFPGAALTEQKLTVLAFLPLSLYLFFLLRLTLPHSLSPWMSQKISAESSALCSCQNRRPFPRSKQIQTLKS